MKYKCEVESRSVYGNTLFYPLNDTAKRFTVLLNCKTLTRIQLKRIAHIGIDIEVYAIINGNAIRCPDALLEEIQNAV